MSCPADPQEVCLPVEDLVVDNITINSAVVTWTGVGNFRYRLYQLVNNNYVQLQQVDTNLTNVNLIGLTFDTTYRIHVTKLCSPVSESIYLEAIFKTLK